ncbi:sensor histidine kinase [Anaeromicrobium sediminis]|uniref:histidine kinase n=1 Tax=Anaeromicrobium sediminis TaxID=1478221 RepID=A0A267MM10_9FIRM|nr:HAMP domain-containing sensor histidine kinase [Anaeromicrobium sediminis]PAB59843.1 hypothetical protein CCE28_07765 [Anaeromicrobium sediminis]
MKRFISSKISIQILLVVMFSFVTTMALVFKLLGGLLRGYILHYHSEHVDAVLVTIFHIIITMAGMITFIGIFYFMTNKKIKYIKHISEKVKEIATGNIGYTIEVKGNDEIAELCNSINTMSLELKEKFDQERENEKIKNDLITNVSHDLRTPLTSIIGYLELIKDHKFQDEKSMDEYSISAYNTSIKMKKLINQLFEYTKLCSIDFQLNKESVDLSLLINQIVGEYTPIFEKNELRIEEKTEDTELIVNIDIDQFMRVLDNLLSNALKYAHKYSTVVVEAYKLENKVKIIVKNKGDYIPEDEINKIFDRLYRIDKSRQDSLESSGIGLSIAKRIIDLHGGTIWANCENDNIWINILI